MAFNNDPTWVGTLTRNSTWPTVDICHELGIAPEILAILKEISAMTLPIYHIILVTVIDILRPASIVINCNR